MAHQYELIQHDPGLAFKVFLVSIERRLFHWHADLELLLVIEGSVAIDVGGQRHVLVKGDLFLINRNEIHGLSGVGQSNLLLALQFDPAFCQAYEPRLQRVHFLERFPQGADGKTRSEDLHAAFLSLAMAYFQKDEGYRMRTTGILHEIAYQLLAHVSWEDRAESAGSTDSATTGRLKRILSHIQANFANKITLSEIAQAEGLDMSYLSHFVKEQLGISFQRYVGRLRLEKAAFLIGHTPKRLIDVCMECGFSDYRYLYRHFFSEFGCSPGQYRQRSSPKTAVVPSESGEQHRFQDPESALVRLTRYAERLSLNAINRE